MATTACSNIKPMTSHQSSVHVRMNIRKFESRHANSMCPVPSWNGVSFLAWIVPQAVCVAAMASVTVDSVHKLLPKDLYPNWLVFPELEKVIIDLVTPLTHAFTQSIVKCTPRAWTLNPSYWDIDYSKTSDFRCDWVVYLDPNKLEIMPLYIL